MELEQHHRNKLLAAYRNGFAVRGQVAASQNSLNALVFAGLLEAREHQPDKRRKVEMRYYLTPTGTAVIEPLAKKLKATYDKQAREMEAKERLEAAAPKLLAALELAIVCLEKDGPASAASALHTTGRAAVAAATQAP